MLTWWRGRSRLGQTATKLYGSIVAAARRPSFYEKHGVPDTPDGRFAMLIVHMYLVLERLRLDEKPGADLSRALVETFVTDMDDCMREMGIGDLGVPRKVKKAAGALYDCTGAFRAAGSGQALAEAMMSTVLTAGAGRAAPAIADYAIAAAAALAKQRSTDLLAGHVVFPALPSE